MPTPLTVHEVTAARRAFASAATRTPDREGILAFQSRLGFTGKALDGDPGRNTLAALEDAAALAYGLRIDRKTLRLPQSQYFPGTYEKDLVVMHHTAGGSAVSSLAGWISDKTRVGTAYFVERDGTVYEVFDPAAAAGNLGLGGRQELRSIGIEICNWGWLQKIGTAWRAWPRSKAGQPTVTIPDADVVVDTWRGEKAWERYPEAQIEASIRLALYLCDRFGPAAGGRLDRDVAPGIWDADDCDLARFKAFRGVISHGHVRRDKTDVSPAYPWERLRLAIERP